MTLDNNLSKCNKRIWNSYGIRLANVDYVEPLVDYLIRSHSIRRVFRTLRRIHDIEPKLPLQPEGKLEGKTVLLSWKIAFLSQ